MKILEDIIATSNKTDAFLISRILFDKQFNNETIEKLNLSKHNLEKLKEIYIVNILKTKNKEITKQISTKEQQIDILKNTSKVTSISKLENTLIINNNELNDLKQKFTILRIKYLNSEERFKEINEEHTNLKNQFNEIKNNYQQAKIDNLTMIRKHISYKEKDKKQKEKLSRVTKSNASMNSSNMNANNNNQSLNQTKNEIIIDEKELEKLNNQIEELKKLNEIYISQLNEKEKEYQGKNNQYNKLKDKFLNLQKAYKKVIEEKNANRNKKLELEKTKNNMTNKEKENKELEKEIEKLNKDIGDEQIKQFTFESEIDKQKLINLEYQEKINNEQQLTIENETKIDKLEDKIQSLKKEIEKMKRKEEPKESFFSTGLGMNLLE
jgi:myosin heavy subunit